MVGIGRAVRHEHVSPSTDVRRRLTTSLRSLTVRSMIGSIRHKALRNYWTKGQTKGLNAEWTRKLRRIMAALEAAGRPEEMNYPGSYFHPLKGDRAGRYAVRLTANMRVTFGWDDDGAADVDLEDYH